MLRRAGLLAALTALLVPAVAGPATADAAKRKLPVVTKITPKKVFVGETLTIRGRNFRRGLNKNTVAFKRRGAKVVFAKAEKGTKKLLKVTLPKRLEKVLRVQRGTPVPTRLQIRVLSGRFGKRFTKLSRSPLVGPEKPPAPPTPPEADPNADCDGDGQINRVDTDDDNDLLPDASEKAYKLDPCKPDTDGDGAEDGYEFASARDLNDDEHQRAINMNVPYPEKRPYPNPLDGTDASTDHDGDSLTLSEEYALWRYTIAARTSTATLSRLSYSAGNQHSVYSLRADGRRQPALRAANYDRQRSFLAWAGAAGYHWVGLADTGDRFGAEGAYWYATRTEYRILDFDRSGGVSGAEQTYYAGDDAYLNDAERDEDADGLPNWWETRGCMTRGYWIALYDQESPYPVQFAGTDLADPDSDGDGVRDGADDQDNDDVPNVMECRRTLAMADEIAAPGFDPSDLPNLPAKGAVNPFNPCMPHRRSRSCNRYVTIGKEWAPFNAETDVYYEIKN
jgi:hypothetical protein